MKVCLIDTAAVNAKRLFPHWTPLGLAYIAATLEQQGHEVLIIERDVLLRKNQLNTEKVDRLMEKRLTFFRPDLIGISSVSELFPDVVKSARIAKALFPDIPVVYGGHHASAVFAEALEICSDIDMVAAGEGEATMLELANGARYEEVKGICFRGGQLLVKNSPRPAIEPLDALPMPARHLLDMDFYTRPSPSLIRNVTLKATTMLTSRGCPFSCAFCVESLAVGKKHRAHSPSRVVAELDHILSQYNIEAIYFLDEAFLTDLVRVRSLCEIMIKDGYNRRVKWAAQVRVDALSQDLLKLMKEAGCIHLECGFETTSDRLLKNFNKKTSSQKNREIVTLIKSSGIRCLAYIIAGLPGETEEEFKASVEFIKTSGVDAVAFSRFIPYPGSIIYNELVQKGMLQKKFWEHGGEAYGQMNFSAMSGERAKALYNQTL
ncbi:MAG TPA: radical SAM protein, partial [Thermodesulfobacteriota bacterium]|nr:radical SAM protein [Thermodesulfobacteriota bacterium]